MGPIRASLYVPVCEGAPVGEKKGKKRVPSMSALGRKRTLALRRPAPFREAYIPNPTLQ